MRNLTLLSEVGVRLPDHQLLGGSHSDASQHGRGPRPPLCVDVTGQLAYVIAGDNHDTAYLLSIPFASQDDGSERYGIAAALPFSASSSEVSGMQFLMERESVFLALKSGDIFTVRASPDAAESVDERIELVGTVDPGIMACCWSPDEELLALVNGEGQLLLMTQDFDVLDEFPLEQSTQGEDTHVALGWGKKETQYHGKAGKAAALAPEKEIKALVTEDDDRQVRISWRGDGAYFAVSYVSQAARQVRIFSREGKLQSTAERIESLEHVLSWRPSGHLIAATEKLDHRYDVVFFERNGLRHGEFTLPKSVLQVLDLAWNSDSSILAITALVDTGSANGPEVCVQLWSDKNYHWYLKQEIRSSALGDTLSHIVWDTEDPMLAHIAGRASYVAIRVSSMPSVSHVASEKSNSAACVIDGNKLLYTPFSYANVPPPMALHTLELPQPISHVVFGGFGDGNDFVALLADRTTAIAYRCEHGTTVRDAIPPAEIARFSLAPEQGIPLLARQIAWPTRDTLVTLGKQIQADGSYRDAVSVVKLGSGSPSVSNEVVAHASLGIDCAATGQAVRLSMAPHVDQLLLLETADGQVLSVAYDMPAPSISPIAVLPEACVELDAVSVGSDIIVIGRTERNQLFANGHLVSPACSSFFLRSDFLLVTTTTHSLRFIPVDSDLAAATVSEDASTASKYDETRRRIERGSTIVLASPTSNNVVFQMPRGNLETVRPRALVLASVRRLLEARRYREALVTCRANRIDMNIIVDHIPAKLVDDFPEFVAQIGDPDLLNLFVSGLRDEDVTKSMYTGSKPLQRSASDSTEVAGKTTKICRALRPVLQAAEDQRFMPTILTTFMCETPANIPAALQLLAPLSMEERDSALTYLLFLSDVDSVYNAALGLYDLPLALLVAQRSQRDPREYLAALGNLNALPSEEYRRYKIDAQLGRSALALEHLFASYTEACGSSDTSRPFKSEGELWSEISVFVGEKELFEAAIGLLAGHPRFGDMCRQLGDHQASKREWSQAASSYLLGSAYVQAIDAFVQAKDWRAALATASSAESQCSIQAIHDIATKASAVLADHHLFLDAATVLLDYTEDDEDAVELLVKGGHWQESMRASLLRGRADLLETTIQPGIVEAYRSIVEDIEEISEGFRAKVARLEEVRSKPLEMQISRMAMLAGADGGADGSLDNIDVMSDTTSMASQFSTFSATVTNASSRMTGSTARKISKNKRKAERRKVRGKKGSVYEEAYLVDSLSKLIDRVRVHQSAVRDMNLALIKFNKLPMASQLQRLFGDAVGLVLEHADRIFDEQR
ncbi:IkappaB kinase complex, IKAP component, partial [Martensiomyces pterosporus]